MNGGRLPRGLVRAAVASCDAAGAVTEASPAARAAGLAPGSSIADLGLAGAPDDALAALLEGACPFPGGLASAVPAGAGGAIVKLEPLPCAAASPARVRMFGRLEVTAGDEWVCGGAAPDRLMQLLCEVALAGGELVPRLEIARTLWPDADEEQRRSSISRLLGRLGELDERLGLEPGSPAVALQEGDGGSVRLNACAVSCDVTDYMKLSDVKTRLALARDDVGAGRVSERILGSLLTSGGSGIHAPGIESSRELSRARFRFGRELPWLLRRAAMAALSEGRPAAALRACRIGLDAAPAGPCRQAAAEHAVLAAAQAGDVAFSQEIYYQHFPEPGDSGAPGWADLAGLAA